MDIGQGLIGTCDGETELVVGGQHARVLYFQAMCSLRYLSVSQRDGQSGPSGNPVQLAEF